MTRARGQMTWACSWLVLLIGVSLASGLPAAAQNDPHAGRVQPAQSANPPGQPAEDREREQHQHQAGGNDATRLPPFIPPVTDADRAAAFPDVGGHLHNDNGIYSFVLVDQLEWQVAEKRRSVDLDAHGWIGRDRDRLWFRVEGDREHGRLDAARAHALYGRQVSRWWDVVVGIRQDVRPGPAQTWAAIGIQGLAPYWFDIEATAYVGASGRTQARFKAEYELIFTNRLILQPLLQVDLAGKADPRRDVGAGLTSTEAGLRLRYEIRRELAPYVGVTWNRAWGKTADFARAGGERVGGSRLVAGLRLWF
jgi:copper resistance protein B